LKNEDHNLAPLMLYGQSLLDIIFSVIFKPIFMFLTMQVEHWCLGNNYILLEIRDHIWNTDVN